jgi:hypothetical protein
MNSSKSGTKGERVNMSRKNEMKKLSLIMVVCLAVLLLNAVSFAFPNGPDGFGGIKWGTAIKDVPAMSLVPGTDKGDEKSYVREGEKIQIGNTEVKAITYMFYKDKLYMVKVQFGNSSIFNKLKETLEGQYGVGKRPNPQYEQYEWVGENGNIFLNYRKTADNGEITYYSRPLYQEKKKDEKEKQRMKKRPMD